MFVVPIGWSISRNSILPILKFEGTSEEKIGEGILMTMAIEYIDEAAKYKGVPWQETAVPSSKSTITVSFSLMFPNEASLEEFRKKVTPKH